MTKSQIKDVMKQAVCPHQICRLFMKYDTNYRNCFPLIVGEKLFLYAEEDDFILDGYSIRRFRDVDKTEIKDDKCLEIVTAEGLLNQLTTPNVDITSFKTALLSLKDIEKNIIIEKESHGLTECEFLIGRIVKVLRDKMQFKNFDADGVWEDEFYEIPFSQITSITFSSRYVDVFSKHLSSNL